MSREPADPPAPFRATDYLSGESFTVQPAAGGWWETSPAPADLGKYYPAVYYGGGGRRFPGLVEALQAWLYGRRARWVSRRAGRPGRVLDVGCGPGHLLARFRALGWRAEGTEATAAAAALARDRYGLEVRAGEVEQLGFAAHSFDLVVSWHTLEHMRDPAATLDAFARILRPGGHLLLSVPNFSSPEARSGLAGWFHLDVPRHLAHFPADVLRGLLFHRGLTIEHEGFAAPEYDAFSLVQTWQNRLGLPPNLLYLQLKRAVAAGAARATAGQRLLSLGLGALQLPFALGLTALRAARGRGAVIVILARKT